LATTALRLKQYSRLPEFLLRITKPFVRKVTFSLVCAELDYVSRHLYLGLEIGTPRPPWPPQARKEDWIKATVALTRCDEGIALAFNAFPNKEEDDDVVTCIHGFLASDPAVDPMEY